MFKKVLIANRGAIACRIARTLRRIGVGSVAVYSEADANALHVDLADEAVCIGPAAAADSYLGAERILEAARATGADAIHPGYGFLSENPEFAADCEAAGIAFIGPTPEQMRAFGLKHTARELARRARVPLLPGSGLLSDAGHARAQAARIGYPVMLKSTAGGGGIGMRLVWSDDELADAYASADRLARANFKEAGIYLEKYVEAARHIEVQVFGDGRGGVLALGERDCSVQRRNQKVIEETPAPGLSVQQRAHLHAVAVELMQVVNYRSAGTVEFVMDAVSGAFHFLEVNTRLQVEHGVTEEVTGVDLVEWMVRLAAGDLPALDTLRPQPRGASIQVRLYAEDPHKAFQPSSGLLTQVAFPDGVRVESAVATGSEVTPYYDPMLAKLIVAADTREAALDKLRDALAATRIDGIETNLGYLRQVVADSVFVEGRQTTRSLNAFHYRPATIDIIEAGVQTTVQDWPGRVGCWDVGVPPSGPMDALAMRIGNRLLGNPEGAASLECTMSGPTLRFNCGTVFALTGAQSGAELDGEPLSYWRTYAARAGSVLKIGAVQAAGSRSYLCVKHGIDVPDYLGAKATFTLGQFGGHAGRSLRSGDVLHVEPQAAAATRVWPEAARPRHARDWRIGVMYGPHGAPDFFTGADDVRFFETDWEVHYNSSRTGVRLIGPRPEWARSDGGEAGLHPSNIHDNAYAIGAIDFTGDMPVILGPDGPSLGGFVCPAVVAQAELWKLGQLRPGDTIRFVPVTAAQAARLLVAQRRALDDGTELPAPVAEPVESPILVQRAAAGERPQLVCRAAGDAYLLLEYGPLVLDLKLRFRVHALMEALQRGRAACPGGGIVDLTPGIRTLQVHYDPQRLTREVLIEQILAAEDALPSIDRMSVPTRTLHLPLSWDDAATRLAIEKYMQSVRKDAPWCPSNIEFIRRINGLDSVDAVKRIVFNASYLVLGLGDVYLGAPVATPVDPRHRLVTTKYNPARTWTPENAVGIGGAYLCVYGMEGPGGYQFVGRTVQMWNRWRRTADFERPWLLRFFDQIRFYEVGADELLRLRQDFTAGRFRLRIEDSRFDLAAYTRFLDDNAEAIGAFKTRQQAAFDAERERWRAAGQAEYVGDAEVAAAGTDTELDLPPGTRAVAAHVPGSVWKVLVQPGQRVAAGEALVVVESMKMEFSVVAPADGEVLAVFCREGAPVSAGQDVLTLKVS